MLCSRIVSCWSVYVIKEDTAQGFFRSQLQVYIPSLNYQMNHTYLVWKDRLINIYILYIYISCSIPTGISFSGMNFVLPATTIVITKIYLFLSPKALVSVLLLCTSQVSSPMTVIIVHPERNTLSRSGQCYNC